MFFGQGMLKSFSVTIRHLLSRGVTVQYPDQRLPVPERSRGLLIWRRELCIACSMCVKICPAAAITLTTVKNEAGKLKAERYEIDYGRCQFCGLCQEICPVKPIKAIYHSPLYEEAGYTRDSMVSGDEMFQRLNRLYTPPPPHAAPAPTLPPAPAPPGVAPEKAP
jgi:NADH-quinone oxidoreductase subunit I